MTRQPEPEPEPGPASLGRRLLVLLLAPLAVLLIAGLLFDYISSVGPVRGAFDRTLGDAALVVAAYLRPGSLEKIPGELPPEVSATLRGTEGRALRLAVRDGTGKLLAGEQDLPLPPAGFTTRSRPNPAFADTLLAGDPARVVWYALALGSGPTTITVAESTRGRDRPAREFLTVTMFVDVLQLIAILLLVILAVRRGLKPLLALRDQLAARSASELEPLDERSVPVEVRTLVASLNALFARMRATAEAQQKFVADAAHQMRTPLAGIQAQLELLERDPQAAPVRDRIHAVGEGIRRLAHAAHQLLTLARADSAATLERDFRTVDLRQLIEETVTAQLDRALAKHIDLGAEAEPTTVTGIDWLLRELLNNLVDNALNYTPPGGAVTLRCGSSAGAAFLEVEDDGPGIAETERPMITERFRRAAGTAGIGTGLGLAIVSDIARVHAASLSLDAGAAGRGTRARIEFPPRTDPNG
ncbi:MAG TPA: sensor histidine kinase N-terminal domain-containing protein [Steroidobacteraceae bacterium]|nr:sensor histidine kinase N-terminal domain-containing protein [Steroidobacteraceae bacterium]